MRNAELNAPAKFVWAFFALALPLLPAGCEPWWWRRPAASPAGSGAELRVGLGWSSAETPGEAARVAVQAAIQPLGRFAPDLVLVWDNWPTRDDGRRVLAGLARHVPPKVVYGGHVAWPASTQPAAGPSVTALAFGGGWRVTAAHQGDVPGREQAAGQRLAETLGLSRGVPVRPGRFSDQAGGELLVLFGEVPGGRAERLLAGLLGPAGGGPAVVGGSGGDPGGSGWQYVAGQLVVDSVWAVKLAGPFRVAAARLSAEPRAGSIREAPAVAAALLAGRLPDPARWRVALMVVSSGWLVGPDRPERLAAPVADRLGEAGPVLLAGWAGDAQIGPDPRDAAVGAGQFDMALAVIEPAPPGGGQPTPTTQPATAPESE